MGELGWSYEFKGNNDVKLLTAKEECAFVYHMNDCGSQLAVVSFTFGRFYRVIYRLIKKWHYGAPGWYVWLSIWPLVSAQVMISGW